MMIHNVISNAPKDDRTSSGYPVSTIESKSNSEFNALIWNIMLQQLSKNNIQSDIAGHGELLYKSLLLEEYAKALGHQAPILKP